MSETKADEEKERKRFKIDIIKDIQAISDELGVNPGEFSTLNRKSKPELIEMLGNLVNDGISREIGIPNTKGKKVETKKVKVIEKKKDVEKKNEGEDENNEEITILPDEMAIKTMYLLNKAILELTEKFNNNIVLPKTGIELHGTEQKLEDKKEDMLEIYRTVYRNYKYEISTYLSPIAILILANLQIIGTSVVEQKAKEIEKKSLNRINWWGKIIVSLCIFNNLIILGYIFI